MMRTMIVTGLLSAAVAWGADVSPVPGDVGLERIAQVPVLPRGDYAVAPQDDGTPLILMIESVKPVPGGGFTYAIRSIGFEPGEYRLADYLVHPDGTRAAELAEFRVQVRGLLPRDHDGKLNAFTPTPLPWFGGYRAALFTAIGLWLAALPVLVLVGRKRRVAPVVEPVVPVPSRAELMRPLVQAAAAGRLDAAGRAELERLMTGYWREQFRLPEGGMGDVIAAMRRHPEAGPLLLALERWLHDPRGAAPGEIDALLAPYAGGGEDGGRA